MINLSEIKRNELILVSTLLVITIILMIADNLRWIHFGDFVGPFRANHWFVWIGILYVAFAVPIFSYFKRKKPDNYTAIFRFHMFGNFIAFILISMHFIGQVSRPANAYPELGTGLVLYFAMIILVFTGIVERFTSFSQYKFRKYQFFHNSATFTFYLIIVVHILDGLGVF